MKAVEKSEINVKKRDSSIELLRIIAMLCIIAHHYVMNSGIYDEIILVKGTTFNSWFSLLFGWGGKTGINCFILISGYFMCKADITMRKFVKLYLEIIFYRVVIYAIFIVVGYEILTWERIIEVVLPIHGIGTGFSNTYLCFFLFMPYLNLLIKTMSEKEHICLICLCLFIGTCLPTFFKIKVFTYIGWFMTLYFIASYIRLYPKEIFNKCKFWGMGSLLSLLLSWGSILISSRNYINIMTGNSYHYVSDCNKIFALSTAVCAFLFFKNLDMKYNALINKIAASTFGVLLIHANSDAMRQWLWRDLLKNKVVFYENFFVVHAFCSVMIIFGVCTLIDGFRIKIIEKPLLTWWDRRAERYKQNF